MSCQVCYVGVVPCGWSCCSKRCAWYYHCLCPQCGRERTSSVFCSPQCASESAHANWCVTCGIRQSCHSSANCVACQFAFGKCLAHPAVTRRQRPRNSVDHEEVSPHDKSILPVTSQIRGFQVLRAVKLLARISRKQYLAYRSLVDSQLGPGAAKYHHGGEGNEHRMFCIVNSLCEGCDCGSPQCEACAVLRDGPALLARQTFFSHAQEALNSLSSRDGCLVMCRVVIGEPTLAATQVLNAENMPIMACETSLGFQASAVRADAIDPALFLKVRGA